MSRLIETIRISNGKIENSEYHFRRMKGMHLDAIRRIDLPVSGIHKLRIVYDSDYFKFEISNYTIRPIASLKLVVDNDIEYDQKFEDRGAINKLLQLKDTCDDILIIRNDLVTDVSFANIVFKKNGQWFTPDSFLLNGTMRQKLLDTGMVKEQRITVDNIRDFTHFKLINAMLRDDAMESEVSNIR